LDTRRCARKASNTIRTASAGILSDDHLAILMTEAAAPGAAFRLVHLEGRAAQLKEIMDPSDREDGARFAARPRRACDPRTRS
jgi:hypothetical protein